MIDAVQAMITHMRVVMSGAGAEADMIQDSYAKTGPVRDVDSCGFIP